MWAQATASAEVRLPGRAAGLQGVTLVTLDMAASLCSTRADRLVEVASWHLSLCWSCSRAASCELLVSAVAVSRMPRIMSEAEQLCNRSQRARGCSGGHGRSPSDALLLPAARLAVPPKHTHRGKCCFSSELPTPRLLNPQNTSKRSGGSGDLTQTDRPHHHPGTRGLSSK